MSQSQNTPFLSEPAAPFQEAFLRVMADFEEHAECHLRLRHGLAERDFHIITLQSCSNLCYSTSNCLLSHERAHWKDEQ